MEDKESLADMLSIYRDVRNAQSGLRQAIHCFRRAKHGGSRNESAATLRAKANQEYLQAIDLLRDPIRLHPDLFEGGNSMAEGLEDCELRVPARSGDPTSRRSERPGPDGGLKWRGYSWNQGDPYLRLSGRTGSGFTPRAANDDVMNSVRRLATLPPASLGEVGYFHANPWE